MWAKLWLPSDSQVPVVVIQSKKLVAKVATGADTDTDLVTMQSLIQKKMGIWKMVMNVEEDIEQGSDSESNYSDTEDVENSADRIQFYEIGYLNVPTDVHESQGKYLHTFAPKVSFPNAKVMPAYVVPSSELVKRDDLKPLQLVKKNH